MESALALTAALASAPNRDLQAGDLVVATGIKGFPGEELVGSVIAGPRPAEPGTVWVREVRGLAPRPAGWEPFTLEVPVERVLLAL